MSAAIVWIPQPFMTHAHIDVTVFLHLGETTKSLRSTLNALSVFWTSYGDLCQRTGPRRPELQEIKGKSQVRYEYSPPLTCQNHSVTRCNRCKRVLAVVDPIRGGW